MAGDRRLSLAEGLSAGILFGTASILIRFLPAMDAYSIGFYRLIIAAGALMAVNAALRRFSGVRLRTHLRRLALLGLFIGLHFVFYVSAVKNTTILNATVLTNTTPVFATILGIALLRLRPRPLAAAGICLSFVGTVFITLSTTNLAPGNLIGDVEALLAAIFWALYLSAGRPVRQATPILAVMPVIYLFAAITMLGSLYSVGGSLSLPNERQLTVLAALGILPTTLGHTLHFSSLKGLTPFQTATLALLEPVVASALAAALFVEIPHPLFYGGAAIVLVGVAMTLKPTAEQPSQP